MDFKITRGGADGINAELNIYVDTWEELAELMEYVRVGGY